MYTIYIKGAVYYF